MKKTIAIYLAGTIKKGKEEEHELCWTDEHKELLQKYCQNTQLLFLDPATRSDDLSDQKSVFGRDMCQVFASDLVIVDTRGRRGLGVGAEMMFAKMNKIPVISWLPVDSYYHRKECDLLGQKVNSWIHPFIYNLSDYMAPTLEKVASWIEAELLTDRYVIKGSEAMQDAMNHYLATQLQNDTGMQKLLTTHEYLSQKLEQFCGMAVYNSPYERSGKMG
jgi:nucleoside 2-deoxyribosyltransferase